MKTDFDPREFATLLDSTTEIIKVLVNCKQYQELTNSLYHSGVDLTLVDAIQALEQTANAFTEFQAESLAL